MAVPSSGAIRMVGIYSELNENDYTAFYPEETPISLKDLSDGTVETINTANASTARPDGSAPHAMSEFYEYDHDLVGTSFSSVIADFELEADISATVHSSLKTFTLTNPTGALTAAITDVAGADYGELKVSMSDSGDPGTSGSGNSATGFKGIGQTCQILNVLSGAASGTIYVRFQLKGHGTAATDVNNCTFTCNSVTDVVAITKLTTR